MIAYVTSIGEPTQDLCIWSLQRNEFKTKLVWGNDTTLAQKLKFIYDDCEEDFIRIDADVVVNRNLTEQAVRANCPEHVWWLQFMTFDWFQQDAGYGGVQFIKKEAIPYLRLNTDKMNDKERPESEMSRIKEFYEPRRFESSPIIMGLHNYKNDPVRVRATKQRRNQLDNYDFELAEKLNEL